MHESMSKNVSDAPIIPYSITLADVQAYLDSKRDDEPIGTTGDHCKCLLAETLNYKYPDKRFTVGIHAFSLESSVTPWLDTYNHELEQLVSDFDSLGIDDDGLEAYIHITKARWLKAMQASTPESEREA